MTFAYYHKNIYGNPKPADFPTPVRWTLTCDCSLILSCASVHHILWTPWSILSPTRFPCAKIPISSNFYRPHTSLPFRHRSQVLTRSNFATISFRLGVKSQDMATCSMRSMIRAFIWCIYGHHANYKIFIHARTTCFIVLHSPIDH